MDRMSSIVNRPDWFPVKGANPIDGQAYWVAGVAHDGNAFVTIAFWDDSEGGFCWHSGPLMRSAYAYAEIDFPVAPMKEAVDVL